MKTSMAELESITMELSDDITFLYILPRLPAKSLGRCACVSKQWYTFLRTPAFRKMNLHHIINDDHKNHQKILFVPVAQPWVFHAMDCESPEDGLTASRHIPFGIGRGQKMEIVTSLHGMVCVALTKPGSRSYYSDIILWNPVTGDYKKLPRNGSYKDCYQIYPDKFGLYYSSSDDDYKLVYVTRHPDVYIYSLKSDSWTSVDPNVFLNKNPSFLHHLIKFEKLLASKSNSIMRIHRNSKKLRYIPTPPKKLRYIATPPSENQRTDCIGYMIVNGCTYFCVAIINSLGQYDTIDLWKMVGNEYWNKVITSSPKQHYPGCYESLHLMKNGNWLRHSRSEENVYVLDKKNNTKKIICAIRMAFSPEEKYMETIVSPNQYIKNDMIFYGKVKNSEALSSEVQFLPTGVV